MSLTRFLGPITGAIDRKLSGLKIVTIEGWVDAGWRKEEGPIITLADLQSGSLDSLRIWRTSEGMHTSFTWREASNEGGQRYTCVGGVVPVPPYGTTFTHIAAVITSSGHIMLYVDGVAQQQGACDGSPRRSIRMPQNSILMVGDLPSGANPSANPSKDSNLPSLHRVACVRVHATALSPDEIRATVSNMQCSDCPVGAPECKTEEDGEMRSTADYSSSAQSSMDLQFEHATDSSYPNRKIVHTLYAGESVQEATRDRVCRPTAMTESQCQMVLNLVIQQSKVKKRLKWNDLYPPRGSSSGPQFLNDQQRPDGAERGDLFLKKKKKKALVLGSGTSVNSLSRSDYERIRVHTDVWAINNAWVIPFLQPDFWHMEFYTMNTDVIETQGGLLDFHRNTWLTLVDANPNPNPNTNPNWRPPRLPETFL